MLLGIGVIFPVGGEAAGIDLAGLGGGVYED